MPYLIAVEMETKLGKGTSLRSHDYEKKNHMNF